MTDAIPAVGKSAYRVMASGAQLVRVIRYSDNGKTVSVVPIVFDLRQEPGAGKPHPGICAVAAPGQETAIPVADLYSTRREAHAESKRRLLGGGAA